MISQAEYIHYLDIGAFGIISIGLLGNVISFVIFSRKAFEKSSVGFYCRSLAVFDSFGIPKLGFGIAALILNTDLFNIHNYVCKTVYMASFIFSPIPGWILVAFSLDQLITVTRTQRFSFIKTNTFRYAFIIGIFVIQCGVYSMAVFEISVQNVTSANLTLKGCILDSNSVYPFIYLLECNLIPFVLMMLLTAFILKCLIKSRRNLEKVASNSVISSVQSQRRKTRDRKWAVSSVTLNLLFIVLTCPLVVVFIFPDRNDYYNNEFMRAIAFLFYYLNFAAHFFTHLASNLIFRNEVLVIFGFRDADTSSQIVY
jgi:hypothetical protein